MATQPLTSGCGVAVNDVAPEADALRSSVGCWRAHHLVYHGDRDLLLRRGVTPLIGRLLAGGSIDRFYFVRYSLGGPHIRLRWRPVGEAASVAGAVTEASSAFFARHPSTEPLAEETIRRRNRGILTSDPLAGPDADAVLPDNSVLASPPLFEVDRYGGDELFAHSLDFFALSSACALLWLPRRTCDGPGRWRTRLFCALSRLAWGLAEDGEGFIRLVGYAVRFLGDALAPCAEDADRVFEARGTALLGLLRHELESLAAGDAGNDPLVGGGRRLAAAVGGEGARRRWFIAASHIHMTANRLGVLNPEEVYLSRLLWRAARRLEKEEPALWRQLWDGHRRWRRAEAGSVADLLPALFRQLHPEEAKDP